ncbi:hypothetical protein LENED_002026 [Lentinula edodes]|uniref:Uncharacterized protein n=1 Tax=Lentinula edodes TaxID=5353 RepID=A0A1Q3DZT4_LENED|nr:hypothetical protein LENED_002026 [Lentinula edodes]
MLSHSAPIYLRTSPRQYHLPSSAPPSFPPTQVTPKTSPDMRKTSPNPPQAPYLLHELWDLDLGNVEATPYLKLRVTSPLPPPTLEDVHP